MEDAVIVEAVAPDKSKRRHIIISIAAGAVVIVALLIVVLTSAKSMPEIINQPFNTTNAAASFSNIGSGNWQVINNTYKLSDPSPLLNEVAGNANLSINTTPITQNEWRLYTDAKALNSASSHDFSIIFDYTDEANYYYVNFNDRSDSSTNGIFKVEHGVQSTLSLFDSPIATNQSYKIELRKKDGDIKVYRDGSFLARATVGQPNSSKIGYGSRGGAAVFDNLIVTAEGAIVNPTPTPSPEPSPSPSPNPSPTPTPSPAPNPVPTPSGGRSVQVTNGTELAAAIKNARPGDVITLADGTYTGKMPSTYAVTGKYYTGSFTANTSGTATMPIVLQGSRKAIIDGGGTGGRYGLYLANASYWQVKGLTIANASKGLVVDHSSHVLLDGIEVTNVGQEAVHFRAFTTRSTIQNSYIHKTGQKNAAYGEGIYIGSANSNWATYSDNKPDKSDYNQVIGNVITDIAAEGLDIKEGSSYGIIKNNTFDGTSVQGLNSADSWVDVKGNNYTIEGNKGVYAINGNLAGGTHKLLDGYQVHSVYSGWGANNVFINNTADVHGKGYGINIVSSAKNLGNIVYCNNTATNADAGLTNLTCKQ